MEMELECIKIAFGPFAFELNYYTLQTWLVKVENTYLKLIYILKRGA